MSPLHLLSREPRKGREQDAGLRGIWLPLKMSELYEGAMPSIRGSAFLGRTTGVAEHSGFKRFETSAKITIPN